MTPHLLGVAEIAAMLGLSRQRVNQLVQSEDFPPPEAELSAGRIWSRGAVEAWVAAHPVRATEAGGQAMFARFSPEARAVVVRSQEEARTLRHGHIGTEHVLLAVLSDATPGTSHRLAGVGVERTAVLDAVRTRCPSGETAPSGHIPFTPLAKQLLERAVTAAGDGSVEPRHIVAALASVTDGLAAELLREATDRDQDALVVELDRVLGDPDLDVPLTSAPADDAQLRCSFCGKDRDDVGKLIAGPGVYICNECVDLCNRIIGDEAPADRRRLSERLDRLTTELEQLRRDLDASS